MFSYVAEAWKRYKFVLAYVIGTVFTHLETLP